MGGSRRPTRANRVDAAHLYGHPDSHPNGDVLALAHAHSYTLTQEQAISGRGESHDLDYLSLLGAFGVVGSRAML